MSEEFRMFAESVRRPKVDRLKSKTQVVFCWECGEACMAMSEFADKVKEGGTCPSCGSALALDVRDAKSHERYLHEVAKYEDADEHGLCAKCERLIRAVLDEKEWKSLTRKLSRAGADYGYPYPKPKKESRQGPVVVDVALVEPGWSDSLKDSAVRLRDGGGIIEGSVREGIE